MFFYDDALMMKLVLKSTVASDFVGGSFDLLIVLKMIPFFLNVDLPL